MITETKATPPKELSPEWFEESQKFLQENKNTDALTLLDMLKIQLSQPPMVDEVEILKHYTGDPNCRFCHGSMRLGINRVFEKDVRLGSFYQLQLCKCAKPNDNEYARILRMLHDLDKKLEDRDRLLLQDNQILYRNTFYGGIKMLWKQIKNVIRKKCVAGYEALLNLFKKENAKPGAEEVRRPAQQG